MKTKRKTNCTASSFNCFIYPLFCIFFLLNFFILCIILDWNSCSLLLNSPNERTGSEFEMTSEPILDGILSQDWDKVVKYDKFKAEQERIRNSERFRKNFIKKPLQNFCTLSSYKGQWDQMGMAGYGVYTYPHGVEYRGNFEEGVFHGNGTLKYPKGHRLVGVWEKGKLISFKFIFPDGLEYDDPWDYCKMPDRRFNITRDNGFQPADKEYLTNEQPTRTIPEGCYDTGDGFYNPKTKCVVSPEDPKKVIRQIEKNLEYNDVNWNTFLRVPTKTEEMFILDHYRKAWDEPTGYRPDLFERWTNGRQAKMNELEDCDDKSSENDENTTINESSIKITIQSDLGSEFQLTTHNLVEDDCNSVTI